MRAIQTPIQLSRLTLNLHVVMAAQVVIAKQQGAAGRGRKPKKEGYERRQFKTTLKATGKFLLPSRLHDWNQPPDLASRY